MNYFMLLQRATKRLQIVDPDFYENTEVTTAVLRSEGVLPTKRMTLNGKLHKLVSAMLVEAYDADTTIDVNTRRAVTFSGTAANCQDGLISVQNNNKIERRVSNLVDIS